MKKNYAGRLAMPVAFLVSGMALTLCINGCKKDQPVNVDMGYSYFPDDIGHYCIYDVDSTVYDEFAGDTVRYRYQVKEVIQSYFTDNEGRQAMRIERYRRDYNDTVSYNNLPWVLSRVWAFTRTKTTGEKNIENQRYVNLVFPPAKGMQWNGNQFNTIGEWDYNYSGVDVPFSINNMNFDSTLTVVQKNDVNLLYYKTYAERYARHAGLIDREVTDVYDNTIDTSSVLTRIKGGVIYSIRLVDWGPR